MLRRRGFCCCSGAPAAAAAALLLLAVAAAAPRAAGFHLGGDESVLVRGMLAAIRREQAEAEDAARFAVAEYNKNQGAELEFARIVKAKRQVVTGTLHDLMLEVVDSGKKSLYSAKVWVKPWLDFKAVVEFRHVGDSQSQSATAADGNAGQDTADPTVASRNDLHNTQNNKVSVDLSTFSQTYSV
ncbi:cysteine proteinase inhibitor 3 [Oryza glaberrima]|uniref:cysteine proteinase inhibitor 3 n=1 Tax=Oryza glaberrima TaxID=4538 RepID=UPI00224BFA1E|nr:cysteine proteinase inhibitor 3 [Oryza glaberrima]